MDNAKTPASPRSLKRLVSHLCATCTKHFATCDATRVVFAIDHDPSLRGASADAVIGCNAHVSANDKMSERAAQKGEHE